jgi:hypothetical protein
MPIPISSSLRYHDTSDTLGTIPFVMGYVPIESYTRGMLCT